MTMQPQGKRLGLSARESELYAGDEQIFIVGPGCAQVLERKAGRLLDPKTGNVLSPAAVLFEVIRAITTNGAEMLGWHAPHRRG